jgi:O-antigen/teichoic acid export membrane protein
MDTAEEQQATATELRTALRHTMVYGMGNMLGKAIGFFMLPFYTHYLTPADYGVLEILDLSMSLLGMFLTMGMTAAVLRVYAAAKTNYEKDRVISSAFWFMLATGLTAFTVGSLLARSMSRLILGPNIPALYLLISFTSLVCTYVALVPRTYLRALEKSGAFTLVDNIGLVTMLGLNIYFIAVAKVGLLGILLSSLIVGAAQVLLLSAWAIRRVGLVFQRESLRQVLQFGAPLTFSNLGLFVLNFSDRFFLKHLTDLTTVGIYAVGYKFGYMMNFLVVQPFFIMWQARMYKVHAQPNHERIFGQIFRLYALVLVFLGLGLSLFSPEIVHTMVRSSFFSGQAVIPIVVLSYVVWGLGFYAQTGMFLTNNTRMIAILGAAAALLNLALNYILIRSYGMMGAAWATLVSFIALAVGGFVLSHRVLPLQLGIQRVLITTSIGVFLYLFSTWYVPPFVFTALSLKVVLLLVFPLLLWRLRVLSADEKQTIQVFYYQCVSSLSKSAGAILKRERRFKVVPAVAGPDESRN